MRLIPQPPRGLLLIDHLYLICILVPDNHMVMKLLDDCPVVNRDQPVRFEPFGLLFIWQFVLLWHLCSSFLSGRPIRRPLSGKYLRRGERGCSAPVHGMARIRGTVEALIGVEPIGQEEKVCCIFVFRMLPAPAAPYNRRPWLKPAGRLSGCQLNW